jgi:hypothetical protein
MESKQKSHPDPELKLMDQIRQVLRYYHYPAFAELRNPVVTGWFVFSGFAKNYSRYTANGFWTMLDIRYWMLD